MNLSRSDKILVLVATICIIGGSYSLYQSFFGPNDRYSRERKLASIESIVNQGRIKGIADVFFIPARSKDSVFNKDTIYSGKNSYVNIKLVDGGNIKLKPESLIYIRQTEDITALNINHGQLRGKLEPQQKLHLATDEGVHRVEGKNNADFEVTKTDLGIELEVFSGDVELKTEKGIKKISGNQKIVVSDNGQLSQIKVVKKEEEKPKKLEFSFATVTEEEKEEKLKPLKAPELNINSTTLSIPNQDYPKSLYWSHHKKVSQHLIKNSIVQNQISWLSDQSDSYEFIYSKKPLTGKEKPQTISNTFFEISDIRPHQKHYFKVRALRENEKGPWSRELIFSYKLEQTKSLSKEIFTETWDGFSKKGSAYIKWTPLLFAHGYEVFISQREDFKGAKSFLTKKPKYPFMVYFNKDYFWKVRAIDKSYQPISEFSKTFKLKVLKKKIAPIAQSDKESFRDLASEELSEENKVQNSGPILSRRNENDEPDKPWVIIPDFWVTGSVGFNYVLYNQKVDSFSDIKYQSLKGPTTAISGGAFLGEKTGFEVTYKNTIGEADDTKNGGAKFNYTWKTFILEALYRTQPHKNEGGFKKGSQWMWRLGFQNHFIPFLDVPNISTLGVTLRENSLLNAHAGFSYFFAPNRRLRYELMLRYQHPLSSASSDGTTFDVDPVYAFDGSIGATYRFIDHFNLGVFWYGQWHRFNYVYGSGASSLTGEQDIIFSNFDLRFGVEY